MATEEEGIARAIARATKTVDPRLHFLAVAGTKLERAGETEGLVTAREIYADRAYGDDALLLPRSQRGAVLHEPEMIAERVLAMLKAGAVIAASGKHIPIGIDSVCVHGDTPNAVVIAQAVQRRLVEAGIGLKPFAP